MRQFSSIFLLLCLLVSASLEAAPIYMNPSSGYPSGEHPNDWLEKRTREVRTQKWLRLKLDNKTFGWTSEDTLLTKAKLIGQAYIISDTSLLSEPRHKSQHVALIEAGSFTTLLEGKNGFSKVRTSAGETGYIARETTISANDLSDKEAVFLYGGMILRSAPTPDSAEIRRSEKFARHKISESATLKWGRVEVPTRGSVWWPLDENSKVVTQVAWSKITSSELFLERKLYDIVASPAVPNLRFASANGIFRSLNDREWEKIPKFGDQNHPVAVSKSGRLFVGFWFSDDHGETFHTYVRFDQLVSSLKNRWRVNPHRFKFIEVKPVNANGSELIVKVDIGLKKPVEAITRNQGITWSAL